MSFLVSLVKTAVEVYILDGKIIFPSDDLPGEFLERRSGAFVTIKKDRKLRGCIGTYLPTRKNIAEEIIHNAISAAINDHRFDPIKKEELAELSYTVYILTEPELVRDISELNAKKFGIIVKSQGFSSPDVIFSPAPRLYQKTGILLPDVEGIDDAEKQISITCKKAGIDPTRENIIIYKFSVEKYD